LAISVSHNNRLTMMLIEEHALCSVDTKKRRSAFSCGANRATWGRT
jgi:hypothetical protein